MMRPGLTTRQQQAFDAIVAHRSAHGQTPTVAEICTALRLNSKSGVVRLLDGLEERGYIFRLKRRARSISVVDADQIIGFTLPPATQAALEAYCRIKGDKPAEVINDAVLFFIDAEAKPVSEGEVRSMLASHSAAVRR